MQRVFLGMEKGLDMNELLECVANYSLTCGYQGFAYCFGESLHVMYCQLFLLPNGLVHAWAAQSSSRLHSIGGQQLDQTGRE